MNCYILVGGLSSRMGVPKAAVTLGEATFEERVVAAAGAAFDEVIAVERTGGGARSGIRTIFEEPHEGRGAMFALERALRDAAGNRLWLLAIDYPLITRELLADLRRRFEASRATMLIPVWDGAPQMLCGGYAPAVAPRVREAVEAGDLRLRALLDGGDAEVVPEALLREHHPGEPLLNVNDPADLERARRVHERAQSSRS